MAVKNCFIRGSVVRYVQLPAEHVDTQLLEDATRRGGWIFVLYVNRILLMPSAFVPQRLPTKRSDDKREIKRQLITTVALLCIQSKCSRGENLLEVSLGSGP